jgi:RHS repeat-associated protein
MRDAQGLLQAKTTPDATTRYAYDALDRLTAVASPQAQQYFIYDHVGQLIEERIAYALTSPGAATVLPPVPGKQLQTPAITAAFKLTHTYDELGNRLQTTLPNGRTIDIQRYGSGHWHGTLWQGRTLVDLERDHLHREVTRQLGAGSSAGHGNSPLNTPERLSTSRRYDPQSRLAAITMRKGEQRLRKRSYQYDPTGNLTGITDSKHGLTTYRYDPVGQLLSAVQPHIRETFSFDPAGNLLDTNSTSPAEQKFDGDSTVKLRNPDHLKEQPQPGSQIPKLAKVTHNLLKQYLGYTYEYDIQGNTVVKRLSLAAQSSQNQASNLVFAYDADNRLAQAQRTWAMPNGSRAAQTTRYTYDAFGRRIAKQVTEDGNTSTTLFVWDGDVMVQEVQSDSTITYLYEPSSFVPLARIASRDGLASYASTKQALHLPAQTHWQLPQDKHDPRAHVDTYRAYRDALREQQHQQAWQQRLANAQANAASDYILHYHCDHLGTPLELMDANGKVVWAAKYKAWGRVLRYERREVEQQLRFQGQYEDAETGLYYNRHRYYDPDQARYLTQDPIGLLGGWNLYSYAPNSTAWIDPHGLSAKCPIDPAKVSQDKNGRYRDANGRFAKDPGWPSNYGFANGKDSIITLTPGMVIDRFGGSSGGFVSPAGTPFGQRALPASSYNKDYHQYMLKKPIDGVRTGPAEPWFGQPGGGTQYQLPKSVQDHINNGDLVEIPGPCSKPK